MNAEAANAPTEGHTSIIILSSGLMEKYWRPVFTLLQPKESELHCTGLAAYSLKLMNPWVALEILSVDMIHLRPRRFSVTVPCCGTGPSLPQLQSPSHRSDWCPPHTHTHSTYAYRCLPPSSPLPIPTGCPIHWIGLFVPDSDLGVIPCFLLTHRTTSFWENGNLRNVAEGCMQVTLGLGRVYGPDMFPCLLTVCM